MSLLFLFLLFCRKNNKNNRDKTEILKKTMTEHLDAIITLIYSDCHHKDKVVKV